MDGKELDGLLKELEQKVEKDTYDYKGYGIIDDLKMTKEDLRKAVDIMWDVVMVMDTKQRENTYLFSKGLIRSKNIFLAQKQKEAEIPSEKKETFNYKVDIFKQRLENVKPLVDFLIKMKEVL